MSRYAHPSTSQAPAGKEPSALARIGSAACGLVLTLGHLLALYVTFIAYMARPAGPWDSETVAHSNFASGLALVLSVITALLTWVFVKAAWLRKWWYAIPTVLAVAALLRLTLFVPEL
ncbi:hypothetical protein ACFOOM_22430 [Streptomyces echinoruber]|uniref:Uncharacterized protein n=2 Tax=Streptomyces TaxID=1883 RepID=A0A918VAT8_9ACTN|nr:hypothetical protein [Streptomyces echinoruber]GGZ82277.1 hypothetical protein GCM10010389_20280 [Streptomyces echinoruber]